MDKRVYLVDSINLKIALNKDNDGKVHNIDKPIENDLWGVQISTIQIPL